MLAKQLVRSTIRLAIKGILARRLRGEVNEKAILEISIEFGRRNWVIKSRIVIKEKHMNSTVV